MDGKMIVVNSVLEDRHREAITRAGKKYGYEALFFGSEEEALPFLEEAEIIFGQSGNLPRHAPRLKWICTPSAGTDQFAAPGCFASPDVVLTNSSGAYGVTIAEHTVMITLEMLRRQPDYNDIVRRRQWRRDLPVSSILGSRVTMLGTGDIGRETARRFRAFRPAAIVGVNRSGANPEGLFDRVARAEELDSVLPETEILIISLPGTAETRRMLDARRLALLPDEALIVNVGRGSVVDQRALERELRAGRLYAALDVFEREPLPAEDSLWDCPRLMILPHVAGNMTLPYTKDRIVQLFLEDLDRYVAGEPLIRRVDLSRGY